MKESTIGLGNYLDEALTRLGSFEMARSDWRKAHSIQLTRG